MKKFIISLMFILVSFAAFAGERKFDQRGNLSGVERSEMNGAFYSATLYFASKRSLYLADFTNDKLYFYITDGEEAYLIPNAKFTQVYWKYPIEISELDFLIGEDSKFAVSILNDLHDGSSYIAHTEYAIYENYIDAINRGEDATYVGNPIVAKK